MTGVSASQNWVRFWCARVEVGKARLFAASWHRAEKARYVLISKDSLVSVFALSVCTISHVCVIATDILDETLAQLWY